MSKMIDILDPKPIGYWRRRSQTQGNAVRIALLESF